MAQVKVYGHRTHIGVAREAISDAIHGALMQALQLPEEKRFQRFFPMDREDFVHPGDRSDRYLIIEISMFEGRSAEAKKDLIRELFTRLQEVCGIAPQDVEITITETPRANWGIRGIPGDELQLHYKVDV